MTQRKTIMFDMDGTTVDFFSGLFKEYHARTGHLPHIDDVKEWDLGTAVPNRKIIYEIMHEPGFFEGLQPLPHAVDVIRRLSEKYHVLMVTAPCNAHSAAEKIRWVAKHMPFIPREDVIVTSQKHLIRADALIDDNAETVAKFKKLNPNAFTASIWYPYVQECAAPVLMKNLGGFCFSRKTEKDVNLYDFLVHYADKEHLLTIESQLSDALSDDPLFYKPIFTV